MHERPESQLLQGHSSCTNHIYSHRCVPYWYIIRSILRVGLQTEVPSLAASVASTRHLRLSRDSCSRRGQSNQCRSQSAWSTLISILSCHCSDRCHNHGRWLARCFWSPTNISDWTNTRHRGVSPHQGWKRWMVTVSFPHDSCCVGCLRGPRQGDFHWSSSWLIESF